MIRFKNTCDFRLLRPQILFAIVIADQVFNQWNSDLWITSVSDDAPGRKPNSLHKVGLAFDARLPKDRDSRYHPNYNKVVHKDLKSRLGPQYDVVLEEDHIHVEFDVEPWAEDLRNGPNT